MRRRLASLALVGVAIGAGCSSAGGDTDRVEGVTVDVDARDNTFDPETVEVAAGTNVRFVNVGRNDHNVIPVSGDQEELYVTSEELSPDAEAVVRLTEPGTYRYYCSIHGTKKAGMIGTIEVTG